MTLADLIARVEGLTGPDREVDAEIDMLVNAWALLRTGTHADTGETFTLPTVPRYTASIEAVSALIERELPGWMRSIMTGHGKTVAHVRDKSVICEDKIEGSGYSSLEACALLSAFLRALDAIAQRNGGKT